MFGGFFDWLLGGEEEKRLERFTDAGEEPLLKKVSLSGLSRTPRVSFMEAIHPLIGDIANIESLAKQCLAYAKTKTSSSPKMDYIAAIHLYTIQSQFYIVLNASLRQNEDVKRFYKILRLLLEGMSQMKTFSGTLWRGLKANLDVYEQNVGEVVPWNSFSSCSRSKSTASLFGSNGYLIEIENGRGFDISQYSVYPSEQEVILPPQTMLRIVSFSKAQKKCKLRQETEPIQTINSVLSQ